LAPAHPARAGPAPGRLVRRHSIARLIAEHGREDYGDLRAIIAHDCPKMQEPSADIYDRCGVHFPELPRWF
jgi:hypothetical protein